MSFIYVYEAASGFVKIGITGEARKRMTAHRLDLSARGDSITRQYVSHKITNGRSVERLLHAMAFAAGGQRVRGREFFSGISFDDMKEVAEMLCAKHRAHPPQQDA